MAPSYYFSLSAMAPNPHCLRRVNTNGRWLPPRSANGNIRSQQITGIFKYTNRTEVTQRIGSLPHGLQAYKCYSIYHDHGHFWIVDYDATAGRVGNGLDTTAGRGHANQGEDCDSSSSGDEDERADWTPLTFMHNNHDGVSYAGLRLPQQRLRLRRPDQSWAGQILTDTYSASPHNVTNNSQLGGLIGDLPLLISLVAFHIPVNHMLNCLPNCMGNPWRVYPNANPPRGFPRSSGWQDRRGLVVTVYFDPRTTTAHSLRQYERGDNGNILP